MGALDETEAEEGRVRRMQKVRGDLSREGDNDEGRKSGYRPREMHQMLLLSGVLPQRGHEGGKAPAGPASQ